MLCNMHLSIFFFFYRDGACAPLEKWTGYGGPSGTRSVDAKTDYPKVPNHINGNPTNRLLGLVPAPFLSNI